MSKWTGKVGFAVNGEVEPGLWVDEVVEKVYKGELLSDRWRRQNSIGINDNINLLNSISIIANPYAFEHCSSIVYVEIKGEKWKVTDIDASIPPRLILTVGGVYNGEQA